MTSTRWAGLALALSVGAPLGAQSVPTRPDSAKAVAPPAPSTPALDFSGVLFANYQYGGVKGNRSQNRFELERAYLTFRAPAGERLSIRITADVFQQRDTTRDAYYRGWTYRVKYAYGQYDVLRGGSNDLRANVRLGILHTPVIDHIETFWPRGLAPTPLESEGFFSSADAGAATTISLPRGWGEIYGGVWNGNGYTSRELDRFKDIGGRFTLTPLSSGKTIFKSLSISPWYYKGARASDFARTRGTVLPVAEGRRKDRFGLFVGTKDPRLVLGGEIARRMDQTEKADTTVATEPAVTDVTGTMLSGFALVKPFALMNSASAAAPLQLVLRMDRFKPSNTADAHHTRVIGGLGWALSPKASIYLDGQSVSPKDGSTTTDTKTWFVHAIVNF